MDTDTIAIIGIFFTIISIVVTILSILIVCIPKYFNYSTLRGSIDRLRRDSFFERYRIIVRAFLKIAERFYGEKALSYQSFSASFLIAYFYPLIFFILSYSFFNGSHEFSNIAIFPENEKIKQLYFFVILFFLGAYYILNKKKDIVYNKFVFIKKKVSLYSKGNKLFFMLFSIAIFTTGLGGVFIASRSLNSDHINAIDAIVWSVIFWIVSLRFIPSLMSDVVEREGGAKKESFVVIAFTSTLLSSIVFFYLIREQPLDFMIFTFVGGVVFTLTYFCLSKPRAFTILKINIAIAFVIAIFDAAVITGFVDKDKMSTVVIYLFFFIILPLMNAFFDWISWAVSRFFLYRSSKEKNFCRVLFDITLDAIFAIILMIVISLCFPGIVILFEKLTSSVGYFSDINVNWEKYALLGKNDPWGEGNFITFMIISTLIPTFIHIVLGLSSVVFHTFNNNLVANNLIKGNKTGDNHYYCIASLLVIRWVFFVGGFLFLVCEFLLFIKSIDIPIAEYLYNMVIFIYL